jgi:PepSY-associated transmembrane protein
MTSILWRALVIIHRYLGVAVGLLMLMWFLSGIVMMYVGFPQASERERLSALPPISWAACCRVADGLIADTQQFGRAEIENLLDVPVLRLRRPLRADQVIDLAQGMEKPLELADARAVAADAAPRIKGAAASVAAAEEIEEDQWTVGRYHGELPLFRFALDDPERTAIYVSGSTGRIVLRTTATQRFWNWLGAVPHWFYLTALRSDGALWSRIVIWASILGAFLTLFGLCLGIAQFRRGKDAALSPYRGLFYWHHMAGLIFGVVTLTFVTSGLVSMNPWGFLDSRGGGERARLEGPAPRWGEIRMSLEALRERSVNAVSLSGAPFNGKLYWLAAGADGTVTRLDAAGNAAPLRDGDLAEAGLRLAGATGIADQGIIGEEDAYYFSHHDQVVLPVYRIVANDAENTRYYLDPTSGALLQRADGNRRWHRWLFAGLHRLDFAAWLRARPAWDIIVLTLMLGGIAGSVTGVYLAFRRVRSDLAGLLRIAGGARRAQSAPRAETS